MKLTCAQMDVLISFYIDGDLSSNLKKQVEEHIKNCATCKAKFEIISSMLKDMHGSLDLEEKCLTSKQNLEEATSLHYRVFKNNLSAYLDNELSDEENLKIKKFAINNKKARKELEDNYNIRRIMSDSFKKTKDDAKKDFSKSILRQLELEEEAVLGFHPAVRLLIAFTITVLVLTSFVLISLSM